MKFILMKTCNFYLTLLFVVFTWQSCSNEVDVIADYEETAAIYGLLNPNQPVQYIKINKMFTNPNAAAGDIAQISDSLFFDTIAPELFEIETGRIIKLYKTNELIKDAGYFANDPNYMYATNEKISSKRSYRLDMRLPASDKYVTATTNIPDSIRITTPVSVLYKPAILEIPIDGKVVVSFSSTVDSKIFDGYFYFNYLEVNKSDTNIRETKTMKWRLFNKVRSGSDLSPEPFTLRITANSFYDMLLATIPVDPGLERRFLLCKMEFTAGNLELDNYIQATEPSIGIVQKQTEYSNITNSIGIFASRSVSNYNNITLGNATKNNIINTNPFKQLGFVK